ncbi:MAG: hypothetical protein EOP48_01275 [Sphingobacteriales bacterium]|nr:MAG: hypothetical protein EOP48_01275 [Sphingobacteriales bacterium]
MIVPSMSLREIHNELKSDYSNVVTKKDLFFKEFRRMVLKASNFPFTRTYECTTPIKKNLYILMFSAPSRGYEDKPEFSVYVIYNTSKGKYLASLIFQHDIITIYAPHFFRRYRERILKDNLISNDEIIRNYIKKDRGFTGGFVTKQVEDCFKSFEEQHQEEPVNFAGATLDGYCFGFKEGCNIIVRTIISPEMVKDDQRELFITMKKQFEEENL